MLCYIVNNKTLFCVNLKRKDMINLEEKDMISKRELLQITGISYGQLYRWKRERLLPEEWFVKQSAYTGQETFLPRELVLTRVKSIMKLKDDYSLEAMAKMFNAPPDLNLTPENLKEIDELGDSIIDLMEKHRETVPLNALTVAFLLFIQENENKNNITKFDVETIVTNAVPVLPSVNFPEIFCTLYVSHGNAHALFTGSAELAFDKSIEKVDTVPLSVKAADLAAKYNNIFQERQQVS